MTKYDSDTKLATVQVYLKGDISYKRTAQKMGVSTTVLKKWVANFREHGITAFKAQYTNYSAEFRLDVLQYIEETGASIEEAASVFNIPSSAPYGAGSMLLKRTGLTLSNPNQRGVHP